MTWIAELAALSTGGVIAAVGYWLVRRLYARVEELLKQILSLLTMILGKLEDQHPPPPDTLQALHDLNVKRDREKR